MTRESSKWERSLKAIRDIVIIGGVPAMGSIFLALHNAQVETLKQQIELLRENQFPKVNEIVKAQRELYDREKWVIKELADDINDLARDIEIATGPGECDNNTKKIIGDDCDLGDYMEWAGPELVSRSERLSKILKQ